MRNSENPKNLPANHQGKCSRAQAVARIRHAIDDVTAARLLGCVPTDPQAAPTVRPQATELERQLLATIPRNEEARAVAERALRKPVQAMWDLLRHRDASRLAETFKFEYTTTIAATLSRLTALQAAEILSLLPESFAMEVIMCMITLEKSKKKPQLCNMFLGFKQQFVISLLSSDEFDEIREKEIFCFCSTTSDWFYVNFEEPDSEEIKKIFVEILKTRIFSTLSWLD